MNDKKTILSGIQPSGALTIGNYLGAISNWVSLANEYNCFYMIADLHAITVRQNPQMLRKNCLDLLALYIACGISPDENIIFFQSHIAAHSQLGWVLACNTYMGELSRMTQFKEKSKNHNENINAGLFSYPALQAADILLYQADLVPVGHDQKQHLELSRDIAGRFNNAYSETFKVPEPYIPKIGARIMSLQNPLAKMSKSDENVNAYVLLLDDKDTIIRKFKRAVTDSDAKVCRGENKAGIENLMNIYSVLENKTMEQIEAEFEGRGYGDFKLAVGESVAGALLPIQEKYDYLMKNRDYLEDVYKAGAQKASAVAQRTLTKVYKKIGFVAL